MDKCPQRRAGCTSSRRRCRVITQSWGRAHTRPGLNEWWLFSGATTERDGPSLVGLNHIFVHPARCLCESEAV
jgi:hypothetical protein